MSSILEKVKTSMDELYIFLESIKMQMYYDHFIKNDIDLELLKELDKDDLKAEGLTIGQAVKLIKALEKSGNKIAQKTMIDLNEYPEFVRIMLQQLYSETDSKIWLWNFCDFFECLLRFQGVMSMSELHAHDIKIHEKQLEDIRYKIMRPTMGAWLSILKTLINLGRNSDLILGINKCLVSVVDTDKEDYNESIISLRNKLAHGGNFSKKILADQLKDRKSTRLNYSHGK